MESASSLIEKVNIDFDTNMIFLITRKTQQIIMLITNIKKLVEIPEIHDRYL